SCAQHWCSTEGSPRAAKIQGTPAAQQEIQKKYLWCKYVVIGILVLGYYRSLLPSSLLIVGQVPLIFQGQTVHRNHPHGGHQSKFVALNYAPPSHAFSHAPAGFCPHQSQ